MSRKILAAILAAFLAVAGIVAAPAAYSAPNPSVKVLDTANTITDPAWFVQAYNAGFRLYIMHSTAWGTCDPWYRTQTQLKMALNAGLMIAVYTRDPRCWQGGISRPGRSRTNSSFSRWTSRPEASRSRGLWWTASRAWASGR
ncbi:hypothetical protein FCN77_14980 [Arthrobacter sp. 24S4-2]|uniref:hypothetical protein n=1 Tax=Arthrobacter sp. 24S4-2 TaxID=2575374 RepID=UPI0010C7A812|nr:hypothetical protein [Arthrobacter sp. 24S4-2]QCO98765.1 hypothetical protein FCN77_14980 [Arthrobacter sp. 24S4-2]